MGKPNFYVPASLDKVVADLNASGYWNLSVAERSDGLKLLDGDQLMFEATSEEELRDFLAGCYLATFCDNEPSRIEEALTSGKVREWFHNY